MKKIFALCLILAGLSSMFVVAAKEDILPEILERNSGGNFDSSKFVSQEQIFALIEAASLAPSAYNAQPWNFIICDKNTNPESYDKCLKCIEKKHLKWVQNAPVLILIVAGSKLPKNHEKNRWAEYDTGAAADHMTLQAIYMGLSTHQIFEGCSKEKIRKEFSIPNEYVPMTILAVGYEGNLGKEYIRSTRFPLEQNFFNGVWGEGDFVRKVSNKDNTHNLDNGTYGNGSNYYQNTNGYGTDRDNNTFAPNNATNATYNNPTPGTGLYNPTSPNQGATIRNDRREEHLNDNHPRANSLRTRTNYNESSEMDGSSPVDSRNR